MKNTKIQQRKVIKCPFCHAEFLPGEVLYPENVTGQPKNVVRDVLGHILYEEYDKYDQPLAEEHFICTNCNKPFIITIDVNYRTKAESEEVDFSDTSTTLF